MPDKIISSISNKRSSDNRKNIETAIAIAIALAVVAVLIWGIDLSPRGFGTSLPSSETVKTNRQSVIQPADQSLSVEMETEMMIQETEALDLGDLDQEFQEIDGDLNSL